MTMVIWLIGIIAKLDTGMNFPPIRGTQQHNFITSGNCMWKEAALSSVLRN
ncbi:hypothetical protein M2263_000915 [Providencia alcalifaciens]|nr:hypothetical protein [Providencia alcalifaciens]